MCQKKKAFVENRDQYRGVFSFCSIGVLLAAVLCMQVILLSNDFIICGIGTVIWKGVWRTESGLFKAK